jgi:hypothetical protein
MQGIAPNHFDNRLHLLGQDAQDFSQYRLKLKI